MQPISALARDLADGRTTARALLEDCLARIADPSGEGKRAFIETSAETARATADRIDTARKADSASLGPWAGLPVSLKDLFDVKGQVTKAGSVVLSEAPPATADAPVVARLRAAGCVFVGRTNMTEFAYSGLGLNPHYGTPASPYDRKTGRISGGSSSGAAVSVTDGMAAVGLGTDTGGSTRIPAALCGLVGYKPTAARIPLEGAFPLSTSLDSIGPIARTAECAAIIDDILAGGPGSAPAPGPLKGLRIGVLRNFVENGCDRVVASAYEKALSRLSGAGALLTDLHLGDLDRLPEINAKGGFAAAEAFHIHKDMLETGAERYDPRVSSRITKGRDQSAADYLDLLAARRQVIRRTDAETAFYDVLAFPTVPLIAPALAEFDDDGEYARLNLLMLRNPSVVNFLDRCAVSIPVHEPGAAPVGLMLVGRRHGDRALLATAQSVEALFP